jgi:hypothetical protein
MTMNTELSPGPGEELDETSRFRSLESTAVRGTYFVTISYGVALALRLVSNVVLSHMFAPDLFGVLTLVTTIITACICSRTSACRTASSRTRAATIRSS